MNPKKMKGFLYPSKAVLLKVIDYEIAFIFEHGCEEF